MFTKKKKIRIIIKKPNKICRIKKITGVEQICNSLNFTIVFFKKYIYAIFFSVKKVKGEEKKSMGEEKKLFQRKKIYANFFLCNFFEGITKKFLMQFISRKEF